MKVWLILLIGLAVFTQGVFAAAPASSRFVGVAEAQSLSGTTIAACQISGTCNDTVYGSISDIYTVMGDGSTAASSTASFRNTSNTQSGVLAFTYDVDGIRDGEYYLRLFFTSSQAANILVFPYYDNLNVNSSLVAIGTTTGASNYWVDVPLGNLPSYAYNTTGRVKLRLVATASASQTVAEAYLKQPPVAGDFQLIPQGTNIAQINASVENVWKMVTQVTSYVVSSPTCSVRDIDSGVLLNANEIVLNVSVSYQALKVTWFSNSSASVIEGNNYRVSCSAQFDGVHISDIEQYVYITSEKTMKQVFMSVVNYLLSIFNFTKNTDSLVTNMAAQAQLIELQGYPDQVFIANGQLIFNNTQLVDYTNVSCSLNVWYPDATKWINDGLMVYSTDGIYLYNLTMPEYIGSYRAVMNCSGGALGNLTTARGVSTWRVLSSGTVMSSIS
jgi:hypothetical protein